MILNFILNLVYNIAVFFLDYIPDVSLPDGILNAVNTASGYLSPFDVILPMATLIAIILIFLAIEGIILIIKIINWIIRKIPGVS